MHMRWNARSSAPDLCFMSSMPLWTLTSLPLCSYRSRHCRWTQRDKLRKHSCKRCIPNVEIRLPGLNKVTASAPSFWLSQTQKGASWQQLCSGMEKVVNNENYLQKGYRFKQSSYFLALPFNIACSLSFYCHCFCQSKHEPGLCWGSEGDRKGDEKGVGGPSQIHSYLDQACRLWEWFWVI